MAKKVRLSLDLAQGTHTRLQKRLDEENARLPKGAEPLSMSELLKRLACGYMDGAMGLPWPVVRISVDLPYGTYQRLRAKLDGQNVLPSKRGSNTVPKLTEQRLLRSLAGSWIDRAPYDPWRL